MYEPETNFSDARYAKVSFSIGNFQLFFYKGNQNVRNLNYFEGDVGHMFVT